MITNKHYLALDYDKILEILESFVACPDAKEMALDLQPQTSLKGAERLLQETLDAHMLLAKYGGPSFGGLVNVNNKMYIAATGGVLSMGELLSVGSTLRAIRGLSDWYSSCEGVETSLSPYFYSMTPQRYLEERIFTSILSEDRMADNASAELKDIRRSLRNQEMKIRNQLDRIIHSSNYATVLQDAIVTMRNSRYVVPVKREHKNEIAGIVQDTSDSGATVFIEPMSVVEANNEIRVLLGKEREEIEKILADLSEQAGAIYNETKQSYESGIYLDLVFAKAQMAYSMKAAAPLLNATGIIDLREARHPLIDPKKVVKTNIRLGEEFDTLVITGPNTGGKTVSIKTLGLMSLMAAAGLMLPVADHSKMCIFESVYADIGDEQSIEQSLSTFSSHITNIVDILEKANEKSLVLIDELGAGTDPVEGAALAMAVLERLHLQGAKIAATTHYAELKAYALETNRVENASCEFDINTLSPTYRLLIGAPGRSNAFAISERLGLASDVVERAKELVSEENTRFERVVESLEQSRAELESEREEADRLTLEARRAKERAEEVKASVESMREAELDKARAEAERILDKARREAAFFMDDLEKLKKERKRAADLSQVSADAKRTIRRHEDALYDITRPIAAEEVDDDYELPRDLVVGDSVIVKDLGPAMVSALPDKRGQVEVTAGILKTRVDLSRVRLDDQKRAQKARNAERKQERRRAGGRTGSSTFSTKATGKVETSVDLRGMTQEEAIMTLDRFLDLQLRYGVDSFTVIHGKGTGVLKKAVKRYLDKNNRVKSHRLGAYGEGEDGVTIVNLK
ncbi:MAG: endonuclease MutS2 [Clostridia bacterium]|nr:endonuclease MutS2 [Clostridia bacterium]